VVKNFTDDEHTLHYGHLSRNSITSICCRRRRIQHSFLGTKIIECEWNRAKFLNITRMSHSGTSSQERSVRGSNRASAVQSVHCRRRSVRSSASTLKHLLPPERSRSRRRAGQTPASRGRRRRSSPSSRPASGRTRPRRRRCTPPCALGTRLRRPLTRGRG